MLDDVNERAVIGGNNPPEPTLPERFEDLTKEVDDLAALGTNLPATIENDQQIGGYASVVNTTRRVIDRIDSLRKQENEPHRRAVEANNGFFNSLADRLKRMKATLEARATAYNDAKAAEERKRRAAEAARLHEEVQRRALEAVEARTGIEGEIARENAERAAEQAARAEHEASGSAADLTRTRTAGGTVSSRTELTFRVPDYSKIDLRELRESFPVDAIDKAIRAHIRRHKKTKPLTGVEIFETSKASFRG